MTAFIKQEALEKAHEIQLKADEEFAIEKSKLVRQETAAIDVTYEKKFKQAGMSQQITRSTQANKTRIRVLTARQNLLDDLFEQARQKVGTVAAGRDYEMILKGLVLEGMYLLHEANVLIRGKKNEKDKLGKAAKEAAQEYKENLKMDIEAVIDGKDPLPDGS